MKPKWTNTGSERTENTQATDTTTENTTPSTTKNRQPRKRILLIAALLLVILAVCLARFFLPLILTPLNPVITAPAVQKLIDDGTLVDTPPEEVWIDDSGAEGHGFTPRATLGDVDAIGVLTIEKIGVSVQVYDSEDAMEDMKKGASHYRVSSYWDGNICVAAHIGNASYSYFERLSELRVGDIVEYESTLGLRRYRVDDIRTIRDDDWSVTERTSENRFTLTTCIKGRDDMRLCVGAIEVETIPLDI